MKNSKKTCGILGTSMGSMLIIVALLTMVGMGSNDTYAAGACVCGAGETQRGPDCFNAANKWVGTCKTSSSPSSSSPSSSKPSSSKPSSSEPSSSKPSSSTASATCAAGTYYDGNYGCLPCTAGFYCPGGTFSHGTADINGSGKRSCPSNATCSSSGFTCDNGYVKDSAGTGCKSVGSSTTNCPAGQYYGGSYGSCIDCPSGFYCSGGTFSTATGDINGSGKRSCPDNATCSSSGFSCHNGYVRNSAGTACILGSEATNCPAGQYYGGSYGSCKDCPLGYYCPGGAFSTSTADIDGSGRKSCPDNATCPAKSGTFTCNSGYVKNSAGTACVASGGGNTGGSGSGSGGNGGGNTGGNGGNTGGNGGGNGGNGNNSGSSNVNQNPGTLTKTPLVIALIGMISVGLGTFTYFKGKKEQNNEI